MRTGALARVFSGAAPALLCWVPASAWACAVCVTGQEDETRNAFLLTTVFMSALPLAMIGSIVGWLLWRVRRLHAETDGLPRLPAERDRQDVERL